MAAIFAFTCSSCGKVHEGSPSYGFNSPDHFACLSEEQKASLGHISSDFCTISHEEGTDYFIRTTLEVPIHGVAEPFTWGVWVSLSEKSFRRYVETYDAPVEGDGFFGWVCNRIPWYPPADSMATDVAVRIGGMRPRLFLHRGGAEEHPLIVDQRNGISIAKAQEIAEFLTHET